MKDAMCVVFWRTVCFSVLILVTISSSLFAEDDSVVNQKRHIYLLIGADNMGGRSEYSMAEMGAIPNSELLNDANEWETATLPLNQYSTLITKAGMYGINPGYLFSQTMSANEPGVSIALVVNAVIKRPMSKIGDWVKGGAAYDDAVLRTKIAQKTGVLKGVLWHQGESDAYHADYLGKLKVLIASLRADLGDANLPFVAGQINQTPPEFKQFNERILKLPAEVPFTGVTLSDGLKTSGSVWFRAKSMRILGQRYAEVMLKIQGRKAADILPPKKLSLPLKMAQKPGYEGTKENLHIYILIGQSNMAGRADYMKEDTPIIDRCWLLNSENKWEPAALPFNRYSSLLTTHPINEQRMGPGYMFAKTMLKNDPSINIGIINNARGSTFINSWQGGFVPPAMKRINAARKIGTIKGILYQQGEADMKRTDYLDQLKILVAKWRTAVGMPELPFVAGGLVHLDIHKVVNEDILKLPSVVPFTAVAGSEGLTAKGVHFDMPGMRIFGVRFADAMSSILNKKNADNK